MRIFFLSALCMAIHFFAFADGYWFEINGTGKLNEPVKIKVCYGGVNDSSGRYYKTLGQLDKLAGFRVAAVDEKGIHFIISLHQTQTCWEGVFTPSHTGSYKFLGINDSLPVVVRTENSGPNIKPVQYLCATYVVEKPSDISTIKQLLDINVAQNGKTVNIQAFIQQVAVEKDTKLRIFNPENWEKLPVTDEKGMANFIPTMKGLYIIRLDWTDKKSGIYQGQAYENTRHRCDYSFFVE